MIDDRQTDYGEIGRYRRNCTTALQDAIPLNVTYYIIVLNCFQTLSSFTKSYISKKRKLISRAN